MNKTKDQEQNRKPRRLSLSRETIRFLDDVALLGLARGGGGEGGSQPCSGTTSQVSADPPCDLVTFTAG